MPNHLLIVGASRGLGFALAQYAPALLPEIETLTLVSRSIDLAQVESPTHPHPFEELPKNKNLKTTALKLDMSKSEDQKQLIDHMTRTKPDGVIYCTGGGPFGSFKEKSWKDHHWALEVSMIAPITLLHHWMNASQSGTFTVVGSRIAEAKPDPKAASYAAAKHGLMGLISSLQSELEDTSLDVRLFSPGYMDTDMLPPNASVRQSSHKILSPETAAQALLRWLKKDGPWHRVLS